MQKILKKYSDIKDIIIFGSYVKGKDMPNDIDIALLMDKVEPKMIGLVENELNFKADIELIDFFMFYAGNLFISFINEGFSIKKNMFLRDLLGIKPVKIYIYDLKSMNKSKKTLFGLALKKNIKKTKGEKISIGSVLIPIESTGYFEDFLDAWGLKYKTKEMNMFEK